MGFGIEVRVAVPVVVVVVQHCGLASVSSESSTAWVQPGSFDASVPKSVLPSPSLSVVRALRVGVGRLTVVASGDTTDVSWIVRVAVCVVVELIRTLRVGSVVPVERQRHGVSHPGAHRLVDHPQLTRLGRRRIAIRGGEAAHVVRNFDLRRKRAISTYDAAAEPCASKKSRLGRALLYLHTGTRLEPRSGDGDSGAADPVSAVVYPGSRQVLSRAGGDRGGSWEVPVERQRHGVSHPGAHRLVDHPQLTRLGRRRIAIRGAKPRMSYETSTCVENVPSVPTMRLPSPVHLKNPGSVAHCCIRTPELGSNPDPVTATVVRPTPSPPSSTPVAGKSSVGLAVIASEPVFADAPPTAMRPTHSTSTMHPKSATARRRPPFEWWPHRGPCPTRGRAVAVRVGRKADRPGRR